MLRRSLTGVFIFFNYGKYLILTQQLKKYLLNKERRSGLAVWSTKYGFSSKEVQVRDRFLAFFGIYY